MTKWIYKFYSYLEGSTPEKRPPPLHNLKVCRTIYVVRLCITQYKGLNKAKE